MISSVLGQSNSVLDTMDSVEESIRGGRDPGFNRTNRDCWVVIPEKSKKIIEIVENPRENPRKLAVPLAIPSREEARLENVRGPFLTKSTGAPRMLEKRASSSRAVP